DLGAHTGWVVLRSDVVRKELAGIDPMRPAGAPLDRGIYDAAWTERTYAELFARAAAALRTGESVIADASWSDPAPRAAAARLATATSSDLVAFRCSVPLELARERAATRARAHADPSDATAGLTAALAARFADWPGAVVLDTARPPREVVAEARRAAGPA
ncbi:MAG TPA: AAA family ATPase, partial [Acidimicrobiia bacterium]|nr:AAA family ATPase [Acidimicrobiia bacterium]